MAQGPNILLIMSDQHHPHILGSEGDRFVRTPTLDRLAAEGVSFSNAYCQSPLCVPSRMSFITARQCSDIRVWSNGCVLPPDVPTFVHGLGLAGYENVLCGRMHFNGPDQRRGFHSRIIGDVDGNLGHIPSATAGQTKAGVEVAGPGRTSYSAYDDAVTESCRRFLRDRAAAKNNRPFFLTVGYVLPHCPYICPKRLFDEYYEKVDVPRLPSGYLDRLHPAMRLWRQHRGVDELTDEQVRTARAAYYGLVTYMDERIGEVLDTLKESGLAEDTVVVYTSDHGEMAGEHRMWWKSSFYEGSVGVPLIMSWPGRFSRSKRVGEVVSLVDVGPTLLDIAGGEPLPEVSGRSLAGFLRGSGGVPDWPDVAFSEYCGLENDGPAFMVRRGPWKLNYYHGYDVPQLFNLDADPGEWQDRAADPACANVRNELMGIVRRAWSGDVVEQAMRRKALAVKMFARWRDAIPPEARSRSSAPDQWKAPPGSNVFPEK